MESKLEFDGFTVQNEHLFKKGRRVNSAYPQVVKLLRLLAEHHPGIALREELIGSLWPGSDPKAIDPNRLDQLVKELRDVLDDSARNPKYIETVPRQGYRFLADTRLREEPPRIQRLVHELTKNAKAQDRYAYGMEELRTRRNVMRAISAFEQATQADPNFRDAYSRHAESLYMAALMGLSQPKPLVERSAEAALKAWNLGDETAEISLIRSRALLSWDWNWGADRVAELIRKAPTWAEAYYCQSYIACAQGNSGLALSSIENALRLEPRSYTYSTLRSFYLYASGNIADAIAQAKSAIELQYSYAFGHVCLGLALLESKRPGDEEEALRELDCAVKQTDASHVTTSAFAFGLARAGRVDEAKKRYRRLLTLATSRYVPTYFLAVVEVALGNVTSALSSLEKAADEHSPAVAGIPLDPRLQDIRTEPRFIALLRLCKLGSSTTAVGA